MEVKWGPQSVSADPVDLNFDVHADGIQLGILPHNGTRVDVPLVRGRAYVLRLTYPAADQVDAQLTENTSVVFTGRVRTMGTRNSIRQPVVYQANGPGVTMLNVDNGGIVAAFTMGQ